MIRLNLNKRYNIYVTRCFVNNTPINSFKCNSFSILCYKFPILYNFFKKIDQLQNKGVKGPVIYRTIYPRSFRSDSPRRGAARGGAGRCGARERRRFLSMWVHPRPVCIYTCVRRLALCRCVAHPATRCRVLSIPWYIADVPRQTLSPHALAVALASDRSPLSRDNARARACISVRLCFRWQNRLNGTMREHDSFVIRVRLITREIIFLAYIL